METIGTLVIWWKTGTDTGYYDIYIMYLWIDTPEFSEKYDKFISGYKCPCQILWLVLLKLFWTPQ